MPVNVARIRDQPATVRSYTWSECDVLLYALALGFGSDPGDSKTLPFVYEGRLKIVPTLPTTLAWVAEPLFSALGADPLTALHGGQKIVIHRPLNSPMTVVAHGTVVGVYDKGPGRGALIVTEHVLTDALDGERVATLTTTCVSRFEGGCGSLGPPPSAPPELPKRRADVVVELPARQDAALLYRLTGDRNPLHVDPAVARAAGFPRPILHGLCTFGMACRAVLQVYADFDPSRIRSLEARFTAPVLPGETLSFELWRDGDVISLRTRVIGRSVVALNHGRCTLQSPSDEPPAGQQRRSLQ